jgi:ABC-type multidrug transport system fused ATPase/permease subunit
VYSDSASDLFAGLLGSFLTVAVVAGMAFDVAARAAAPGRCVAVLYLFAILLRSASSLPALARVASFHLASARRVQLALQLRPEDDSRASFAAAKGLEMTPPTSTETDLGVEVPTSEPASELFAGI